jgi:hypothetical protein
MSGMLLETSWAFNEQWNNKFYYKIASCWLFLLIQIVAYSWWFIWIVWWCTDLQTLNIYPPLLANP